MSLGHILAQIWAGIKSLFNSLPAELKTAVHIAVQLTENIKNFVDSPLADVLTAIIPTTADDMVKQWLRLRLPGILTELRLVEATLGLTDPAEITAAAIKVIQGLTGDTKSAFLHDLSIMVAQVAADGKLTWSDGVYILEMYYKYEFKPVS